MIEGNQLADYTSNMTIDKGNYIFVDLNNMDTIERNSNKLNCSYVIVLPSRR